MSADIIMFRPKPNPNREKEQERQAIEIMTMALMGDPVPLGSEPVYLIHADTAPCEYLAPDKDSA